MVVRPDIALEPNPKRPHRRFGTCAQHVRFVSLNAICRNGVASFGNDYNAIVFVTGSGSQGYCLRVASHNHPCEIVNLVDEGRPRRLDPHSRHFAIRPVSLVTCGAVSRMAGAIRFYFGTCRLLAIQLSARRKVKFRRRRRSGNVAFARKQLEYQRTFHGIQSPYHS